MLMLMKCNAIKEAKHLGCYTRRGPKSFLSYMYFSGLA
jgi:hypothetical protein